MAEQATFEMTFTMIDNQLIDVSLQEDHVYESDVTSYPVESGGTMTDNIRPKPVRVTMTGVVSNTPLTSIMQQRRDQEPGNDSDRSESVISEARNTFGALKAIWRLREPVTIRTSLNTYENMAMTSLSIPRSKDTGDALHFTASFEQIQIVTNSRVRVRSSAPICKGKRDAGPLPPGKSTRVFIWRRASPPGSAAIYSTERIFQNLSRTPSERQIQDLSINDRNEPGISDSEYNARNAALTQYSLMYPGGAYLTGPEVTAFELDNDRDNALLSQGRELSQPTPTTEPELMTNEAGTRQYAKSPRAANSALARKFKPTPEDFGSSFIK